ncbi:MAG: helix-hairpin-helix domain-containing protein [Clostridia bacterium]|nr:helix-hairpin-helix domain-containing protein [Clostridia bacterium]
MLIVLAVFACLWTLKNLPRGDQVRFEATERAAIFSTPAPPDGTIRVNDAELEDLIALPGIGETLAQAILTEKELHGSYHYAEDLMAAKGIGPAKLRELRPWLDMSEGE